MLDSAAGGNRRAGQVFAIHHIDATGVQWLPFWQSERKSFLQGENPYEANADETCACVVRICGGGCHVVAEEQSRNVLGKIDHQALLEAAPGIPATAAEASRRTYGTEINANADTAALDTFYAPFYKRVDAARDVINGAVEARSAHQEALAQRTRAQADASPIVNRMGGTDKIGEMSKRRHSRPRSKQPGSISRVFRERPATLHPAAACRP